MLFKGKTITLDNYWEVFGECSVDILDEIRLAIMDDVNIFKYVDICGEDNFKLGQIRMALRENVPTRYINTRFSGECIKIIRYCHANNINLRVLDKYIDGKKLLLDADSFLYILSAMKYGADIESVDLRRFNKKVIPIVSKGILQGYPMYIFEDCSFLTESYVELLMQGLSLGIDVTPFIQEHWSSKVITLIFSHAKKCNINEFLGYINANFGYDEINILLGAYEVALDIKRVCMVDSDGYCIYNRFQMEELLSAIKRGYPLSDVFNPKLSDTEMAERVEKYFG